MMVYAGLLLAAWAATGRADTVVLTNGARLTGTVTPARNGVSIQSRSGTLTLPSWRIVQVIPGPDAAPSGRAPEAGTPDQAPAPSGRPGPARAPVVAEAMARRITVDFSGASVYEVLDYIRAETGVNMALAPEVRTTQAPVDLSVRDVPLRNVLDVVLEPTDLGYTVRPGEILFVGAHAKQELVTRIYPIGDLLVSVEDRGGDEGSGTSSTGSRSRTARNPQYASSRRGARATSSGGSANGDDSDGWTPRTARAENLILLIKSSCGHGTWEDPYSSGLIDAAGETSQGGFAGAGF